MYAGAMSSPEDLARAATALQTTPGDLDVWLELAARLAATGANAAAIDAFVQLGQSACDTGRVALAVACARWLASRDEQHATRLTNRIIDLHAAGSPRIDPDAPPPPLSRPGSEIGRRTGENISSEAAIAVAQTAVATAAQAASQLAPRAFAPTPLISMLGPAPLRAFIHAMTVRAVPRAETVIAAGEPARSLFWLARGSVDVTRDGQALGELVAGAFFGEIALLSGSTRTARVTTTSDAWLLEIPTEAVEAAATTEPRLAEVLARYARSRLLANLARTSDVFTALSPDDRADLLARFESVFLPADETFIHRGQENRYLWVVVSGRCIVQAGPTELARVGPGAALGEISLLERKPATADVVTAEPSSLLRLSRDEFQAVAAKYPEVLAEVYKLVVARSYANRSGEHDATELVV